MSDPGQTPSFRGPDGEVVSGEPAKFNRAMAELARPVLPSDL
jgi:hypothetical protein